MPQNPPTNDSQVPPLKFNMGCGFDKRPGWINVDSFAGCNPDEVVNLESVPWPWLDNSADAVMFNHSLEHLGRDPQVFLGIMKELYRICQDQAVIDIRVPHPRHDNFINDPTHVRPITADMLFLFDKESCLEWARIGASNTPLALHLDVDFYPENVAYMPDPRYAELLQSGKISGAELEVLMREKNNVVQEIQVKLRVKKPSA